MMKVERNRLRVVILSNLKKPCSPYNPNAHLDKIKKRKMKKAKISAAKKEAKIKKI